VPRSGPAGGSVGSRRESGDATVPTLSRARRPAAVDPEPILRHNRAIGSWLQKVGSRLFTVYLVGSLISLGFRIFCRLRVVRLVPLRDLEGDPVMFVGRHFYEWDPPLTLTALGWKYALTRPGWLPYVVAGDFWFRIPALRALCWLFNILCLVRDHEPEGAMATVAGHFHRRPQAAGLMFPTGPIGQSKDYRVKPGIGWLAEECPEAQILPVTMIGLQEIRLRDVLLLRRPRLTLVSGTPFRGRDVAGADRYERELAVCERVQKQWQEMERWVLEADRRPDRAPAIAPSHA
jgi:1-acyl-sn-glycerol-3-phosphate acyltransferase